MLTLYDTNLDGYDARICDMFPTLHEEAKNMRWGSKMEIHLFGGFTEDEIINLFIYALGFD